MTRYLKQIYEEVLGEKFNPSSKGDKNTMQAIIYLLSNMGLGIGDYSYTWGTYGPYSIGLDCDASNAAKDKEVEFSDMAYTYFGKLNSMINKGKNKYYSKAEWVMTLAGVHYMKYVLKLNENDIPKKLGERISNLNHKDTNKLALELVMKNYED